MQLIFNQPKVNFKASFDNNIFTKGITKSMAYYNPEAILAAELALKDMNSEDKVCLSAISDNLRNINIYTAKGQTEITLGSPIKSATNKLLTSICDGTLLGRKPRGKKAYCLKEAKLLINDIKEANASEQKAICLKLARLKQEADKLRAQLKEIDKDNKTNILHSIEKRIFEITKTVK